MFRSTNLILSAALALVSICPAVQADSTDTAADPALAMGDRYAQSGAFDLAIAEYKRVLFFDTKGQSASSVHVRIASCYQAQERWSEAFFHLRQSIQTASSLSEIEDREFALITALLAGGRENEAELHLLRLRDFSEIDGKRVALYLCVTYVYRGHWNQAEEELERAFPEAQVADPQTQTKIEKLKELLSEARSAKRRSAGTAVVLSTILPGSGQLYAGDPWDALNALALNAGLATLIVTAIMHEYYLEGVLLFLYPFRRYYLGNRDNARRAAERKSRAVDQRFQAQIMDEVLSLLEAE
ncbi:MAG: hypothetical protein JSV89_11165 [Spirochaetaceae bacterium]|nr:MAG: hypothetical protein JSV89_11165 [Spirochaetaceae bacterium]